MRPPDQHDETPVPKKLQFKPTQFEVLNRSTNPAEAITAQAILQAAVKAPNPALAVGAATTASEVAIKEISSTAPPPKFASVETMADLEQRLAVDPHNPILTSLLLDVKTRAHQRNESPQAALKAVLRERQKFKAKLAAGKLSGPQGFLPRTIRGWLLLVGLSSVILWFPALQWVFYVICFFSLTSFFKLSLRLHLLLVFGLAFLIASNIGVLPVITALAQVVFHTNTAARYPVPLYIGTAFTFAWLITHLPVLRKGRVLTFSAFTLLFLGPCWDYYFMAKWQAHTALFDFTGRNDFLLTKRDVALSHAYAEQFLTPTAYRAYISGERLPSTKGDLNGWNIGAEHRILGDWDDYRVLQVTWCNLVFLADRVTPENLSRLAGVRPDLTPAQVLAMFKFLHLFDPENRWGYRQKYGRAMASVQNGSLAGPADFYAAPFPADSTLHEFPTQVPAPIPAPPFDSAYLQHAVAGARAISGSTADPGLASLSTTEPILQKFHGIVRARLNQTFALAIYADGHKAMFNLTGLTPEELNWITAFAADHPLAGGN